MPLSLAKSGESALIKKVGGKEETKRFLANLGFVPGVSVTVVSEYYRFNKRFKNCRQQRNGS